jgi:c-di-GMP-binding flagellar brake protein YcgR
MTMNDRRRFVRVSLPMFYRPARLRSPRHAARDVSRGGLRVLTDDPLAVGTTLEIELFLPDDTSVTVEVRVVWLQELSTDAARFEAGLEFLQMEPEVATRLDRCLDQHQLP